MGCACLNPSGFTDCAKNGCMASGRAERMPWSIPLQREYGWQPIETAPSEQIVDVLFDPDSTDMPEFYCPAGALNGVWRRCNVYKRNGKWYASDGLEAMGKRQQIDKYMTFTHWMAVLTAPIAL